MYYTVITHSGHLRTLEKCRKHLAAAYVFYISLMFSNVRRVLSQCNTRLRLLYLLKYIYIYIYIYIQIHTIKLSGFHDYPDFFSGPNLVMNINFISHTQDP